MTDNLTAFVLRDGECSTTCSRPSTAVAGSRSASRWVRAQVLGGVGDRPPGSAARAWCRSSAIMTRRVWSARRRFRHRLATFGLLPHYQACVTFIFRPDLIRALIASLKSVAASDPRAVGRSRAAPTGFCRGGLRRTDPRAGGRSATVVRLVLAAASLPALRDLLVPAGAVRTWKGRSTCLERQPTCTCAAGIGGRREWWQRTIRGWRVAQGPLYRGRRGRSPVGSGMFSSPVTRPRRARVRVKARAGSTCRS